MSRVSKALAAMVLVVAGAMLVGCTPASEPTSEDTPEKRESDAARAERVAVAATASKVLADRASGGAIPDTVLKNGSFEVWSEQDPKLPAEWRAVESEVIGKATRVTGAAVKDGKAALQIVADQGVVSIGSDGPVITDTENAGLRGKMVSAGVWAKADAPATAFISIRDGVEESAVIDHPGDGTWQFLAVSLATSPTASRVMVRVGNRKQDGTSVALFDGAVLVTPAQ